jgi:hypothetical protein
MYFLSKSPGKFVRAWQNLQWQNLQRQNLQMRLMWYVGRLTIFFFSLLVMEHQLLAQKDYRILSVKKINQITEEKENDIVDFFTVDYNKALATIFSDGSSTIIPPPVCGNEGIFFFRREVMDEMIAKKEYPVGKTGNFWESEKLRLADLPQNIPFYLATVEKKIRFKCKIDYSETYLAALSNAYTSSGRKNSKLKAYFAIMISEIIRTRLGAHWALRTEPALNVYYYPVIVDGDRHIDIVASIFNQLEIGKYAGLDLHKLVFEKDTTFYQNNIKPYARVFNHE